MFAGRSLRAIYCGLILAGLYVVYFGATLLAWTQKGSWDAQIAAAIVSFPTSALFLGLTRPLLPMLGEYGSAARDIAVWAIIFASGTIQYFVLGFAVVKLWFRKNNTPSDSN